MAEGQNIKLFKIASEINIGKDAIVDFLQSKGFDIENKPTASLNEEMLEAVYEKFKKEKIAAEKQREKLEKHKIKKVPTDSKQKQIPYEKPVETKEIKIPHQVEIPKEFKIEQAPSVKPTPKTISVKPGDVIKLEEKEPKVKKQAPPLELKIVGRIEPSTFLKQPTSTESREKNFKVRPTRRPETVKPEKIVDEIPVKEQVKIQPEVEKLKEIEKISEVIKVDERKISDKEPEIIKSEDVAPVETSKKEETISETKEIITEETKETQEVAGETTEQKAKKRKKKKRIVEIEYGAEDQPKLKGLTIVGRIDLETESDRRDKKVKKKPIEEEDEGVKIGRASCRERV